MELQGGFRLEDSNKLCRKFYSQKVLNQAQTSKREVLVTHLDI